MLVLTLIASEYIVLIKSLNGMEGMLVTEKNKNQNKKLHYKQNDDYGRIEKRGSPEILREHDNSSLISIMNQIKSDKKNKK